jgi:hypothetical protein
LVSFRNRTYCVKKKVDFLSRADGKVDIEVFPIDIGTSSGNTGLDVDQANPWNEGTILEYLNSLDYGEYQPEIWDCEDRAFWGATHVRHRFPGCAIGIASGKVQEGDHAVIILWCPDKNGKISSSSKYIYYDPRKRSPIDEASFTAELFVPLPMESGGSEQLVPPLNGAAFNTPLEDVFFIWDYEHDWESFKIQTVVSYIQEQEKLSFQEKYKSDCKEFASGSQVPSQDLHKIVDKNALKSYWDRRDRALWAFTHARRKFKGFPTGIALGKSKRSNDDAVIVLWEDPSKWIYLHLDDGIINNFVPRIVWV